MKIKQYIKHLIALAVVFTLFSCEEDINKTMLKETVVSNTLSDLDASSYTLTFETKDEVFNDFEWTEPDFGFTASITYTLQVDVASGDFSGAINLLTTQNLTASPTKGAVNAALLALSLPADAAAEVSFRVMSVVSENVDPLYSNIASATVTPYLATFPPIYIIGEAQGWNLANALEMTSTGPGTYEAVGLFTNGGTFRFFETPSWDASQWNYTYFESGTIPSILIAAQDNDNNFRFDAEDGVYEIKVNLNTKTITMEEGELPTLFVIGDGQSWDLQNPAALTFLGGGKFEGTATLNQDGKFRFFEKADWNATQYGYGYFDGNVPAEFTQASDNDDNFIFTGATATYNIMVNLNDKSVTYEIASPYPTALYLVGDDQGWSFGNSPVFKAQSEGVFQAKSVTFTKGTTFRFFEESDNWSDDYNYDYFNDGGSIDSDLSAVGDGDGNFKFEGETGTYDITVSFVDKTIVVVAGSPYPTALYLVGDDQGWSFGNSPTFENEGNGVLKARGVNFTQGSKFRFFAENANWDDDFDYTYFTTVDSELEAAGDNDANFKFAAATGVYTITVNFSDKSITVEAGSGYPTTLFIVGDDQSWSFTNAVSFTDKGNGLLEATGVNFSNGSTFRFFETSGNWSDDYSYAYFTGSVSSLLASVGDNDDNFKFTGTTGAYKVTVDLANKTVDLTQ